MQDDTFTKPTFRRVKFLKDKTSQTKKYKASYKLVNDHNQDTVVECDLHGNIVFTTTHFTSPNGEHWELKPNRKVMPSRWALSNKSGEIVAQIDQKILGKLTNPLYKVAMTILDASGNEIARLVDPRKSVFSQFFEAGPFGWALLSKEKLIARKVPLSKPENKKAKGIMGKLTNFINSSDPGFILEEPHPATIPPLLLIMILLLDELTGSA